MKLLRRHTGKSVSVDFVLYVESSGPWPSQYGNLAVQWHRGKKSGQTRPTAPDDDGPSLPTSYDFREALVVPCTLYKGAEGEYEDKALQLFVAQVDERGREMSVLGGLEINVAQFAEVAGAVRQEFQVECDQAICNAAGGRPMLLLTIAAARGGQTPAQVAAELAASSPAANFPSTLSTDEDSSMRSNAEPGSRMNNYRDSRGASPRPSARSAASATPAPQQAPPPVDVSYDSDGFIVDDMDEEEGRGAAAPAAAPAAGDGVKRSLAPQMEEANAPGGGAVRAEGDGSACSSPDPTAMAAAAAAAAALARSATPEAAAPALDSK
jgi:hypothetical protein